LVTGFSVSFLSFCSSRRSMSIYKMGPKVIPFGSIRQRDTNCDSSAEKHEHLQDGAGGEFHLGQRNAGGDSSSRRNVSIYKMRPEVNSIWVTCGHSRVVRKSGPRPSKTRGSHVFGASWWSRWSRWSR
jgi:hypothetical protein